MEILCPLQVFLQARYAQYVYSIRKSFLKQLDKIFKFTIVFTSFALILGCSINLEKGSPNSSEAVKVNAELAIKACGQGNVKKVSSEGYECKE